MLILRVAEGHAWQKDTMGSMGGLSAEGGDPSGAEHSDGSGAAVAFHLATLPTLPSSVYPLESETDK